MGGDASGPGATTPLAVELRLPTTIGTRFDGLEEGNSHDFAQPSTLDVFGEIALQRVMAGHLVELAALFVEPHPQPALLVEDVGHVWSNSMPMAAMCCLRVAVERPLALAASR